jgi:SAM-dependent methyltransferase
VPLPPEELRFLVAGSTDAEEFIALGAAGFQALVDILAKYELEPAKMDGILDFGCGCGRVLRHWQGRATKRLAGCDYNPALLDWCKENLAWADFSVNSLKPPLEFADASFDLVYAFSVFTHWPERLQFAWMRELGRVLRPGGHLVMSTHGASHLDVIVSEQGSRVLAFFPAWQQALFRAGQLVTISPEKAGENACAAFHPEIFVRNVLAPFTGFSTVGFVPAGALGNPHQDLYLLRKAQDQARLQQDLEAGGRFEEWYLGVLPGLDLAIRGLEGTIRERDLTIRQRQVDFEAVLEGIFSSRGWKLLELLRTPFGRRWSSSTKATKDSAGDR